MKNKETKPYFFIGFGGFNQYFCKVAEILRKENEIISGCFTVGYKAKLRLDEYDARFVDKDSYEEVYSQFNLNDSDNQKYEEKIYELDNKYGSLWKFAYSDRQLIQYNHDHMYGSYALSHDQILRYLVNWFLFFENRFIDGKYTHVINYATASSISLIMSKVIKRLGGHYLEFSTLGKPDRFVFFEGSYTSNIV